MGCWAALTGRRGHLLPLGPSDPAQPLLPFACSPCNLPRLGRGCCPGTDSHVLLAPSRSRPLRSGCTPHGSGEAGLWEGSGGNHFALDTSSRVSQARRRRVGFLPGGETALSAQGGRLSPGTPPSLLTVAPSWPRWTLLRRCGSPRKSTKRMALVLFIVKPSSAQGGGQRAGRTGGEGSQSL